MAWIIILPYHAFLVVVVALRFSETQKADSNN